MEPSSEHEVAMRSTAHRVYLVRREPAQSLPPPGVVTTFRIWGSAVPTSTTTPPPPPPAHRDPRCSPRAYDAASPRPTPTPAPGDSTFPAPGLRTGGGGSGGDRGLPEPLRACGEPVVFRTWVRHHGTVRTLRLPQGRVLASRSDSGAWRWAWLPCSGW